LHWELAGSSAECADRCDQTAVAAQKTFGVVASKPEKIDREKRKHPRDRGKIILDSENQARHWTRHLGVTRQELARQLCRDGA
jgi:uncharacterized protein DUF3606